MSKVAIIGNASWGTALGIVLARKGTYVKLWTRTEDEARTLNESRENSVFLPGFRFPSRLTSTSQLDETLHEADLVILAVPAQSMRENARRLKDYLKSPVPVVSAAKGLEVDSGKRMTEVIAEELPSLPASHICALSGPTISQETAQGLYSVAVVAANNIAMAERVRHLLMSKCFCLFPSTDVVGVELGGAYKNIVAIGAGMADGLDYGDNSKAAYILRALGEMMSLGMAMKAEPSTFIGPAGLGDLITTSFSPYSRNRHVGMELAKGKPLDEILKPMRHTVEGISTSLSVRQISQRLKLEMPVSEALYKVFYEDLSPHKAIKELVKASAEQEFALIQNASKPLTESARRSRWHRLTLGILHRRRSSSSNGRARMPRHAMPLTVPSSDYSSDRRK